MRKIFTLVCALFTSAMLLANEVNVYTHRHYDTDKELFAQFEKETGIKVNVVKAKAAELIKRMEIEGKDSPADVLITVDAGNLHDAKVKGLLQSVDSSFLNETIPNNLRDTDNTWFGLTYRARIFVYDPAKTDVNELSTYEDLADPKWRNKILVRSSTNVYNQSLIASMIVNNGYNDTVKWSKDLVKNFARTPQGNDRAQAKGILAGEGEVAIMNTYYMGKMATSSDPEEKKVAETVKVFFPNQDGRGAHINVSGAGVATYSKNKDNAIKFIEFLASEKAQKLFAEANFEYPVNKNVEASELVKSWGDFKADTLNLTELGVNKNKAIMLADQTGWK